MATSRFAVALAAAFFASTASVWPSLSPAPGGSKDASAAPASPFAVAEPRGRWNGEAWPPPGVRAAPPEAARGETDAPTEQGPTARMERTSTGAHRLVVEQRGTFVHLGYREVASGGPDWASIELRAGDKAPPSDVAVWESTDPETLVTRRGLVRFSLDRGARPEVSAAEPPRPGPRSASAARTCQSHEDGASGFAVVCRVAGGSSGVHAIRPTADRPLSGAWVWDLPKKGSGKGSAPRFVRLDLPLSPGAAEAGALAYTHAGRGVVVRAEAIWPSEGEPSSLLITESSRAQPMSSSFSWWR